MPAPEQSNHVTVKRMEGRKIRLDRWCKPCGVWCGMKGNCVCCQEGAADV